MAEPLKTFFSPALVERLAGDIARVYPSFRSRAFVRDATNGHVVDAIVNGAATRVGHFTVSAIAGRNPRAE